VTSDGEATMKGANQQEMEALQRFSAEGLMSVQTTRFRLDPEMSYVPAEVRAQAPSFWMPKAAVMKKTVAKKPGAPDR